MNHEELIRIALENGAAKATVIPQEKIILNAAHRDDCAKNYCGNYGRCWMCPPHVGPIDELMAKVRTYTHGLLYQTIGEIEDSYDIEGMFEVGHTHATNGRKIRDVLTGVLPDDSLHLINGGCGGCERCSILDGEPCRTPENAMPSMESYGVDVYNTCKTTDLKYINGQNTVTYFGIVLFSEEDNG
ncbi:MAG: DUF2284 domain-containing protein [Clostridia bacterium]|nr:DUF2284 domain-containing protein [Clostridia bacterium]